MEFEDAFNEAWKRINVQKGEFSLWHGVRPLWSFILEAEQNREGEGGHRPVPPPLFPWAGASLTQAAQTARNSVSLTYRVSNSETSAEFKFSSEMCVCVLEMI